jgi:hypothetical protein
MALMSTRSWDDWIAEYSRGHTHPANRFCHTIGIPMIALSIVLFAAGIVVPGLWRLAAILFGGGGSSSSSGTTTKRSLPSS